jgi:hypothetical protein
MKMKCVKLGPGVSNAVFFWEEGPEGKKSKVVKTMALNEEFEVEDQIGHEIIAKYKEVFQVVSYGASEKKK